MKMSRNIQFSAPSERQPVIHACILWLNDSLRVGFINIHHQQIISAVYLNTRHNPRRKMRFLSRLLLSLSGRAKKFLFTSTSSSSRVICLLLLLLQPSASIGGNERTRRKSLRGEDPPPLVFTSARRSFAENIQARKRNSRWACALPCCAEKETTQALVFRPFLRDERPLTQAFYRPNQSCVCARARQTNGARREF